MAYLSWKNHLPTEASPAFLAFIDHKAPLSRKLREKWLYALAKEEQWDTFVAHYQPSKDTTLQCYEQFALYQEGQHEQAIAGAKSLWLTGKNQPDACDKIFDVLIQEKIIDNDLILERVKLALEKHHVALAKYLITKADLPNPHEKRALEIIQRQPSRIASLEPSKLHSHYYLYGLKRLVSSNPKKALKLWEEAKRRNLLDADQKQTFLSHLALYRALRNQPDSSAWFAQVEPASYSEGLLDWQIRYSLRQHEWARVKHLIQRSTNQDNPAWQYWLARADEALGNPEEARVLYQKLAQQRHYYGFLASVRLKQPMAFEHEPVSTAPHLLEPYHAITDHIKQLYSDNQRLEASRIANDFISELPKEKKSAFVAWLADDLHWTGKSVYLSGEKELANQLNLRFPLAHRTLVKQYSKQFNIPEALIYAMIRQESAFREDVISPVGAHGLMQLMPKTAKQVARREHITYTNRQALFSPNMNINLGTAYLNHLAKRFDRNPLLMVAAYNAGPHQVNRWIKTHPIHEIDVWIDTLPWAETRNYLKAVMAFYAVYQHRLHQPPSLSPFMQQKMI
ncbi:MAG: transglycosylase SLT domain-containing protein [Legionellaceae bacterium]|nr:transglycosylase SLT domain-containing protein [Legionellaceae bacterium]